MVKTIELSFDGYYRDVNRDSISNESGVYLVYRCVYNKDVKPKPTVTLKQLIYIGESETVKDRIGEEHEKREKWEEKLETGEVLCFSFAAANKVNRERAEAALVYKKKPICNDQGKNSFNYESTTVKSSGACAHIPDEFTVEKTQ
ncbi:GIY-YIG nuclease family protein [archaeon]|nr:GIY-YIG nuclease family protein [archaeon]